MFESHNMNHQNISCIQIEKPHSHFSLTMTKLLYRHNQKSIIYQTINDSFCKILPVFAFCYSFFSFPCCFLSINFILKRDSGTGVFLWILQNFWKHLFYRTPLAAALMLQVRSCCSNYIAYNSKNNLKLNKSPAQKQSLIKIDFASITLLFFVKRSCLKITALWK